MNNQWGEYYYQHRNEFFAEEGHEKLLVGLKQFVKKCDDSKLVVGIDVGSCIGNYVHHIQEICCEPNKRILCIEPNPVNLEILHKTISNETGIEVIPCCVSNVESKGNLYNWKGLTQNESGNEIAGLRSGGEKICEIPIRRLENILDETFHGKDIVIKFIKIDTEGNDTNVIKGLGKYLAKTKYIIFECSDCLDDTRGPGIENPMKDIVDYLSDQGFDTYRIGTKKCIKVNDEYWNDIYEMLKFQSNCFALKKEDPLIYELIQGDFTYTY